MSSCRTMSFTTLTDCALRLPVGIDAHAVEHAVAHPPEDPEAVPLAVRRHVRVQPALPGARPRRGSRASARATAACAGTRAARRPRGAISGMNCTALAPVPITATRLPRRSTSWSQRAEWNDGPANESRPGDVGERRPVELADRADDRVRLDASRSLPSACAHVDRPALGRRRTTSPTRTSVPKRMCVAQAERVGAALEVVEQHVLRREVQRPVVALRERVAVVVVRVVDAAAGIRVLEPRAADVVVLLDDRRTARRPAAAGARRAGPTCPRR